jgi:GntR family transcriptional regulator/MocR family aminotransferase
VLAPGIRIGFVITTPDLIDRLAAYRSFADLQGDAVLEYAMADLFDDGLIQRHVRRMLRIYRSRLEALSDGLQHHLGGFLTFRRPSGGTAIWVRMRDAQTLTAWSHAARRAGVLFDVGSAFTLDGVATARARLGFACLTEDELKEAVRCLATAAQAVRARAFTVGKRTPLTKWSKRSTSGLRCYQIPSGSRSSSWDECRGGGAFRYAIRRDPVTRRIAVSASLTH